VDAGHGGVPHVERFIQRRVEHQLDRQKNRTQLRNNPEMPFHTSSGLATRESQKNQQAGWLGSVHKIQVAHSCINNLYIFEF